MKKQIKIFKRKDLKLPKIKKGVTPKFRKLLNAIMKEHDDVFRKLAEL